MEARTSADSQCMLPVTFGRDSRHIGQPLPPRFVILQHEERTIFFQHDTHKFCCRLQVQVTCCFLYFLRDYSTRLCCG